VVVVRKSRYRSDRADRFEGAGIDTAIGVPAGIAAGLICLFLSRACVLLWGSVLCHKC
jgi:hypothetical protein